MPNEVEVVEPNKVFKVEPNVRASLLARLKYGEQDETNIVGFPKKDGKNEATTSDLKGVQKIEEIVFHTVRI